MGGQLGWKINIYVSMFSVPSLIFGNLVFSNELRT